MLRPLGILLALVLAWPLQASESGALALRGLKQFQAGRYSASYALYRRSLDACAKEADAGCAARTQINMALLDAHAGEYQHAEDMLDSARADVTTTEDNARLLHVHLQTLLLSGDYVEAARLWTDSVDVVRIAGGVNATLFDLSGAEALALTGHPDEADTLLAYAARQFDDDEGQGLLAWTRGRIAESRNDLNEASRQYRIALEKARIADRHWYSGHILATLGALELKRGEKTAALKDLRRARDLFSELGLLRPYIDVGEQYLRLAPGDKATSVRIQDAKKVLEAPTDNASIND